MDEITINQIEKYFKQFIFKSFNTSDNNYIQKEAYKKSTIKTVSTEDTENIIKNSTINLSKSIPQKILLKNSNSNPSLIRKSKNINIKPQRTFFKSANI